MTTEDESNPEEINLSSAMRGDSGLNTGLIDSMRGTAISN
jgi:hypothetical protein